MSSTFCCHWICKVCTHNNSFQYIFTGTRTWTSQNRPCPIRTTQGGISRTRSTLEGSLSSCHDWKLCTQIIRSGSTPGRSMETTVWNVTQRKGGSGRTVANANWQGRCFGRTTAQGGFWQIWNEVQGFEGIVSTVSEKGQGDFWSTTNGWCGCKLSISFCCCC